MGTLSQDVRYALRWLAKNPGFTAVAVLTLSLGIGANAAIFSFVRGVLLRSLPYPEPDRLVQLWNRTERDGQVQGTVPFSYPDFKDWRDRSKSFESMAAFSDWSFNLTGRGTPEQVPGALVSASFFRVLGVPPVAGRTFQADEDQPGRDAVAVITRGLWERRFASDPKAIGASVTLNGKSFVVVGVVPSRLPVYGLDPNDEIFAPVSHGMAPDRRGAHWLGAVGRLAPGATLAGARAELTAIAASLEREYPDSNTGFSANLLPARDQLVGSVAPALAILLAAVALVLLIAAVNVANMLLARASGRAREIAVRAALGAGRGRILRQLMTESAVLALGGALLGLLAAVWGVDALKAIAPKDIPRLAEVRFDGTVAAFAVAAALVSTLVFGLAPAWGLSRSAIGETLKDSGSRSTGGRGKALRNGLVVAELALSVVLVTGAGLLLKSLVKLQSVDLGFRRDRILTFQLSLRRSRYADDPDIVAFHAALLTRLRALPGVEGAETIMGAPLTADRVAHLSIQKEGRPADPSHPLITHFNAVSPGYFALVGIPLVKGRLLADSDAADRPRAGVVSEEFVRRHFPGEEALGRRISLDLVAEPEDWISIVGIVKDSRDTNPALPPEPQLFTPQAQIPADGFFVLVKTSRERGSILAEVRRQVAAIDPEQPIYGVRDMDDVVSASLGQPRFRTLLIGGFGLLALLLASVGVYGVVSYSVAQRTREIGIRMALGAAARDVLRLVLSQAVRLAAIAVVAGLAVALVVSRSIASLLYGVTPADPATLFAVAVLLSGVALLSCWVPAWRASRVDPNVALRQE